MATSCAFFCLSSLCLVGCEQKPAAASVDVPDLEFHVSADEKMSARFSQFTFIQLESTDDCVVPSVRRVLDVNDTLVVLSSSNDIYTFERDTGKYIATISSQGEGPEEYVEPSDIILAKGQIGIVDRLKGDIKFFSTSGRYLSTKTIGGEVAWMTSAEATNDNKLLINSQLTGGFPPQKYAYTLADIGKRGKGRQFDEFAPVKVGQYSTAFAEKPATACGDGVTFLKFLNDTLFRYHSGAVTPLYRLGTLQPFPSREVVAKQGDYDITTLSRLCQNGNFFPGFDRIFETRHLLLMITQVPQLNGFYWVDKDTRKGYICPGTSLMKTIIAQVLDGRNIYNPVGSSDDELIQAITPDVDIELMQDLLAEGKVKPFDTRIKPFVNKVDPEGNICLFIYSHK